jgi:hypothetical protein
MRGLRGASIDVVHFAWNAQWRMAAWYALYAHAQVTKKALRCMDGVCGIDEMSMRAVIIEVRNSSNDVKSRRRSKHRMRNVL